MKSKVFYGWVVVAVTALALLVSMGARSAPGVFIVPIQQDLLWSRATLSFAASLGLMMLGVGGPVSGYFIDRYGVRKVGMVGLVVTALSFALSAGIYSIWQLNLFFGFLSGLGTGLVGSVMGPAVANRWFIAKRGLVTGIFGASGSAGQLLFLPLFAMWVSTIGWRNTSLCIAAACLVVLIPVWLLLRDKPEDVGTVPLGGVAGAKPIKADSTIIKKAVRSLDFWLLCATFFVCGATSNGIIGTHFIAHQHDHGMAEGVAASYLALMGAFNFVGTLGSGWLTDRYDPRKLLSMYYVLRGFSLFLLPYMDTTTGITFFAVLFGLDYIATVPPTTALVADRFGRQNVGTVYGWVFFSHQVGAALAAWLGGVAKDHWGNYTLAFVIAGVVAVSGGMLSLSIRKTPKLVSA